MERLTKAGENGFLVEKDQITQTENGLGGPAVERLAAYENLRQELTAQQEQISAQLEELRLAGKTKTVKFRELLGKKLTNSFALNMMDLYVGK